MTQIASQIQHELDTAFKLTRDSIDFFRENGFVKLKHVLSADAIQYMDQTISDEVVRLNIGQNYRQW